MSPQRHASASPRDILVVEDDLVGGPQLARFLSGCGYRVALVRGEAAAQAQLQAQEFDAVILDLTLADGDGYALLAALRARDPLLPVLCTSGRCDLDSRVKGLRSGFDHYLTKPFAPEELEAVLVRAWCRDPHRERREDGAASPPLNPDWRLHQQARALVLDGQLSISLTETELRLLYLLEQRAPEALSYAALIAGLGHHQRYYSTARLHTAISRLRRKIAQATDCPPPFSTVYGAGYAWNSAPESPRDRRQLSE